MKIYNEIITRFNETTGKWETVFENSYDYTVKHLICKYCIGPSGSVDKCCGFQSRIKGSRHTVTKR